MPFRVLIADDSVDYRQTLAVLLGGAGLAVEEVGDGSSALRRLLESPFDLSLMDIHMPQLTGLQVLDLLRRSGLAVPSILMTGDPSRALETAAFEAGARAFLRKPIPAEILRITVEQIIQPKGTPPQVYPEQNEKE